MSSVRSVKWIMIISASQMRAIDKSRIINSLGHRDMTARDDIAIAISLGCASFLSESDQRLIHA